MHQRAPAGNLVSLKQPANVCGMGRCWRHVQWRHCSLSADGSQQILLPGTGGAYTSVQLVWVCGPCMVVACSKAVSVWGHERPGQV